MVPAAHMAWVLSNPRTVDSLGGKAGVSTQDITLKLQQRERAPLVEGGDGEAVIGGPRHLDHRGYRGQGQRRGR